jgi:all-trans-nonaprenyl-diphosphate synthase
MQVVGAQNPLLMSAAKQIFSAGGKRMRPALIFLVSKATAELAGLKYLPLSHLYFSSHQYANIIQLLNISLCDELHGCKAKSALKHSPSSTLSLAMSSFEIAPLWAETGNFHGLKIGVLRMYLVILQGFAATASTACRNNRDDPYS